MNGSKMLVLAAVTSLFATPVMAEAQVWKRIQERVTRTAEREVGERVEKGVERAFEQGDQIIECLVTDRECIRRAESQGKQVTLRDAAGNAVSAPPAAPSGPARDGNDFVRGERVLFATDFSAQNVGDFPRRLEFVDGNMAVVEWQGRRLLRATSGGEFIIRLPEALPERFTIEFDAHLPYNLHDVAVVTGPLDQPRRNSVQLGQGGRTANFSGTHFGLSRQFKTGLRGGTGGTSLVEERIQETQIVPVRITVDGRHAKMYLGDRRIASVPNADIRRSGEIRVSIGSWAREDRPVYLGDFTIAAGGADLYDALAATGRVATHGILFDTGSDRIRPESAPTLREIGEMLRTHPDLRLTVEGHTDSVGDDAANLALSAARAAAVTAYLSREFGIDAGRLQARGLGETRPSASNDTPAGRQQNRRVELVRQP